MSQSSLTAKAAKALEELQGVFQVTPVAASESLVEAIAGAKRVCLYGVGREGLMMKAFAMRLFHLGLDAHVVGDMTTPPVANGDLLIVSAGPGSFSTVLGLLGVAKEAGATTLTITAQPGGEAAQLADVLVHLPAQTMADDKEGESILPMGTLYEASLLLFSELIVIQLRERLGQSPKRLRSRHTNLE